VRGWSSSIQYLLCVLEVASGQLCALSRCSHYRVGRTSPDPQGPGATTHPDTSQTQTARGSWHEMLLLLNAPDSSNPYRYPQEDEFDEGLEAFCEAIKDDVWTNRIGSSFNS